MINLDTLNTPEQASEKLGLALPTLAGWRMEGTGPAFIKMGHFVRYTDSDIAAWLAANRRTFTNQAEAA